MNSRISQPWKSIISLYRRLSSTEVGRSVVRFFLRYSLIQLIAAQLLLRLDPVSRRIGVRKLVEYFSHDQIPSFCELIARRLGRIESPELDEIRWLAAAYGNVQWSEWQEVVREIDESGQSQNGTYARAIGFYERGDYKSAVLDFRELMKSAPNDLRINCDYLKAAYAASNLLDLELATKFFSRQYFSQDNSDSSLNNSALDSAILESALGAVFSDLSNSKYISASKPIAFFFLSSTQALGHALLDPYHFLALNRQKYDHFVFIGPSRSSYRPASAVALQVIEQYGKYIETDNEVLLNLSWMYLGHKSLGPFEIIQGPLKVKNAAFGELRFGGNRRLGVASFDLIIDHYWSLLREVTSRSRSDTDTFQHNSWHLRLPDSFNAVGERFCNRHQIDLQKPIVVLHAREQRYHGISKQSYRNASIDNYQDAISRLLKDGYQVIRIGDVSMKRLTLASAHYYELPFMQGYDHRLDPFFISRSRFMIGSQSGPCAYARAFGTPILSINAVLHYTLLPSVLEMGCFKRYVKSESGCRRKLTLEEALDLGAAHFDNNFHVERMGITLEDASSEEITASVKDMIDWLDDPAKPETTGQLRFKLAVEQVAKKLSSESNELNLPIGDYRGMSLPGYRISPSVAAMREGPMT